MSTTILRLPVNVWRNIKNPRFKKPFFFKRQLKANLVFKKTVENKIRVYVTTLDSAGNQLTFLIPRNFLLGVVLASLFYNPLVSRQLWDLKTALKYSRAPKKLIQQTMKIIRVLNDYVITEKLK